MISDSLMTIGEKTYGTWHIAERNLFRTHLTVSLPTALSFARCRQRMRGPHEDLKCDS
jgi:hypothetical protein